MQHRKFGRTDWLASCLGFGAMRLPTTDGAPMSPRIDERESVRMIRHAIERGVNYIDTAYPYHGGQSEVVTGKALAGEWRDKVKLATKSPVWLLERPGDFDRYLGEQLARLQTDRIDLYLLHALAGGSWQDIVLKHGILARAEAAMRDGRIGHLGFSFHGLAAEFPPIVDGFDWTFCQIQYNYMDIENQAGAAGLRYAAAKGLAVVIMEPLLGGKLANPPRRMRPVFDQRLPGRTPADLALQWLWSQPEVSVVLSGMGAMEQVEANLASAERSRVGAMTAEELTAVDEIRAIYRRADLIPCTKCGYCQPCPTGVEIPRNFELYNDGFIHEDVRTSRGVYAKFLGEDQRAGACVACRVCEERCPQQIPISEWMPKVHAVLGEGKDY